MATRGKKNGNKSEASKASDNVMKEVPQAVIDVPELFNAFDASLDSQTHLNDDFSGALKSLLSDIETSRYRTLESAATRLQKESKGYLDSLRGTSTFCCSSSLSIG